MLPENERGISPISNQNERDINPYLKKHLIEKSNSEIAILCRANKTNLLCRVAFMLLAKDE